MRKVTEKKLEINEELEKKSWKHSKDLPLKSTKILSQIRLVDADDIFGGRGFKEETEEGKAESTECRAQISVTLEQRQGERGIKG